MLTEPSGYARNFSKGLTPLSSFNPPNSPMSWELIISLICTEAPISLEVKACVAFGLGKPGVKSSSAPQKQGTSLGLAFFFCTGDPSSAQPTGL